MSQITYLLPSLRKCVRIRNFSGPYLPTFGLKTDDSSYLSVFSPNAEKYGQENSEYGHFSRSGYCQLPLLSKGIEKIVHKQPTKFLTP